MPTKSTAVEPLSLHRGNPLVINSHISVNIPKLGQIADMGEEEYYRSLYRLIAMPQDVMAQLDKLGIDWEQITDYNLFLLLHWGFTPEETGVFLGDLNISTMRVEQNEKTGMLVLVSDDGTIIDLGIYTRIVEFLCAIHGIKRIKKRPGNAFTKQAMMEDAYMALNAPVKEYKPILFPLVSAMVNHPGFKRNDQTVYDMNIYAFMDSVRRISLEQNCFALINGMYSGMVDASKIKPSDYDWFKSFK